MPKNSMGQDYEKTNSDTQEGVEGATLEWHGRKTCTEAKKYHMTRGFVAVELYQALLQQKPRKRDVTREWIREASRALFSESVYPLEPGGSSTTKMAEKLEEKITELGFEVEE